MAKMTNGLLRPTSGEVLVGEQPTVNKTVAAISRHVGYVFQNPDDQICNQSIFLKKFPILFDITKPILLMRFGSGQRPLWTLWA